MKTFKKIAVLMGGTSSEREISLMSGANVADALESLGYEVVRVTIEADNLDPMPKDVDAAYIALHGGWGENGGVQAALDALGIPYTGPGAAASRAAMDKIETKKILDAKGVPTAPWRELRENDAPPFPFPFVVKTARGGSSIGVHLAKDAAGYSKALEDCLSLDSGGINAEKFIAGREMTVGIIDDETLPAIEIVAPGGWYGYEAKYFSDDTRYLFLKDRELERRLSDVARAACRAIGCRSVTRVDFRVDGEGRAFVLELNTSPGFTSHSLVPKAGMETGLSFAKVCEKVLLSARCDGGKGLP